MAVNSSGASVRGGAARRSRTDALAAGGAPVEGLAEPQEPSVVTGPAATQTKRRRRKGRQSSQVRLLVRVASVVVGLALWQLIGVLKWVDPLFLPKFSTTINNLWHDITSGSLNQDLIASGEPFLIGLVISVIAGSLIGIAMGLSWVLEDILTPWVLGLNAVPRIAFIPMAVVAFGLAIKAHTAVVVATGIFPMIINMHAGVRSVDTELLEMSTSFRASRWLSIRRVVMPSTAPFFVSGFRMTIALALVGEVVAEFFSASSGIGYRLNVASQVYDIPEVYSMILVLAVVGIILASLSRLLERRVEKWYGTSR